MCGRTRCTVRVDEVGRACGFSSHLRNVDSDRYRPSYNVSPGRYMPVVRNSPLGGESTRESAKSDAVEPVVHCMKWGLVPSFTKKNEKPDHFRMFNARSESVHLKSSFRRLLAKSRCVAAVEGFYEWKKDGPKKQPYYVHFEDGRPLVFAGLYDSWKDEEDNTLYSFTILTTRSSKAMDWLHDRMPVILPNQDAINSWMNDPLEEESIHKLTQPYEALDLVWHPVTTLMGKPAFDGPECIQEVHPKVASNSQIAQLFGKKQKGDSDVEHNILNDNIKAGAADERGQTQKYPLTEDDRIALLAAMEPDSSVEHKMPNDNIKADAADEREQTRKYPLTEDDRIALLAAMEPDPGSEETIEKVKANTQSILGETKPSSQTSEDVSAKVSSQKGSEVRDSVNTNETDSTGTAFASSPRKEKSKDSPEGKRRRLSVSPKLAEKKGGIHAPNEKQSSLLTFFGKA